MSDREKSNRYYQKNKERLTLERKKKKTFSNFIKELSESEIQAEARFLASFLSVYEADENIVAKHYVKLREDLKLTSEQRRNIDTNFGAKKALRERLKTAGELCNPL